MHHAIHGMKLSRRDVSPFINNWQAWTSTMNDKLCNDKGSLLYIPFIILLQTCLWVIIRQPVLYSIRTTCIQYDFEWRFAQCRTGDKNFLQIRTKMIFTRLKFISKPSFRPFMTSYFEKRWKCTIRVFSRIWVSATISFFDSMTEENWSIDPCCVGIQAGRFNKSHVLSMSKRQILEVMNHLNILSCPHP